MTATGCHQAPSAVIGRLGLEVVDRHVQARVGEALGGHRAGSPGPRPRCPRRRVGGAAPRRRPGPRRTWWPRRGPGSRARAPGRCRSSARDHEPGTPLRSCRSGVAESRLTWRVDRTVHLLRASAAGVPRAEDHRVGQDRPLAGPPPASTSSPSSGCMNGSPPVRKSSRPPRAANSAKTSLGHAELEPAGRRLGGGLGAAVGAGQVAVEVGVGPQPVADRRALTLAEHGASAAARPALRTANHHGPSAGLGHLGAAPRGRPARPRPAGRSPRWAPRCGRRAAVPGSRRRMARVISSSSPLPQSISPPSTRAASVAEGAGWRRARAGGCDGGGHLPTIGAPVRRGYAQRQRSW